ncbi:hypothetical protein HOR54_gp17 [Vibrio phage Vp670]|uniref:Uncharacterized protein n=1 Tax=Vibrio phage Vp670 TaxID=1932890 RepID=A0A1L7DQ05_9CAUD|nr:hypothetical protein HOR54_gp17 [Vibrio phage Vp670]APU00154.1 hypothetical protein QD07_17 [Vibrio phage Vp670]
MEMHKTYHYFITTYYSITVGRAKRIAKRYRCKLNMNKNNPTCKGCNMDISYSKRTKKLTITHKEISLDWQKFKKVL